MATTKDQYGKKVYEGILPPWWTEYDVSYPDDVTEVYTYSAPDSAGTLVIQAIINVTFSSPLKDRVTKVKKTYQAPGAY